MTLDTDPQDPGPDPSGIGGTRRRRWPGVVAVVVLGVAVAVFTAAVFIRVPYVIISPGEATALGDDIVTISGARTYDHGGELLFLTVRVTNDDPNLWRYLFARLDDEVSVVEREDVIGCADYAESARLNDELMAQSQDVAKQVALRDLGYEVAQTAERAVIVGVECEGPSQGHLQLADVVVAVDGTPVSRADDVRPLVLAHAPGDTVRFTVRRDDVARDISVRLGRRDGVAFAGIATQTFTDSSFPVDIRIDTARVNGPSAGLAFTLAIIDDLTPGDLTGGRKVAITGSIQPDGRVGVVGGVAQKAVTARRSGARLMLVPFGEAQDARDHADGMRVVAVRTLDDALAALAANGGDPVPDAAPVSTGQ